MLQRFRALPIRGKLLAMVLVPLAVVLPLLSAILLVWGDLAFDSLLITKVRSDLAVARGYFDQTLAEVGSGTRGVAQHGLGEVHQVVVRPVGRIELHHREFGVVPNADAFVAEVAVDFKHALKTTDQQALQVQLRRDAQEHLLIECVVVRLKRLGIGSAWNGVQHGRFHLQEAVADHEFTDATHGPAAGDEAAAG